MAMYEFHPQDAEQFAMHVGIPVRAHGKELIFKKCPYCGGYSKDKEKFSINLVNGQFQCFRASCHAILISWKWTKRIRKKKMCPLSRYRVIFRICY